MPSRSEEERAAEIVRILKAEYANAHIVLQYSNTWELLVAVILSAQCTDKKVNEVTAQLFSKYRTLPDYAGADLAEIESDIRPTGFFRNKAKSILGSARMLLDEFGSELPRTMDEMLRLPGVARKTANVVLGNAYGVVEGIAVDTHVKRLAHRLRLTTHKDPGKVEKDLMGIVPHADWFRLTYLLIEHGRVVCSGRRPKCADCALSRICPSALKV